MQLTRIIQLLILLKSQAIFSQPYPTDSLFLQFRQDVETEQRENDGQMVIDDETKESYYRLIHYSSIRNLVNYTHDPNVYIRSSVFAGLLQKKIKKPVLEKIVAIHRDDTAKLTIKAGDVVTEWRVTDFMQAGLKAWSLNQLNKIDYESELEKLKTASMYKPDLEGLRHGILEKEILLKTDYLKLKDSTFKIVSFTLVTDETEISNTDSRLCPEMKEQIKKVETGGLVIFENIKVFRVGSPLRQLPSLVIRLK